jgi:hypothetical protein
MYNCRMQRVLWICIFFFLVLMTARSHQPTGTIKGMVVNTESKEPVSGVNILLLTTQLGTTTDSTGRYTIDGVPAGSYSAAFQNVAYARLVRPDVIVRPDRITYVNAELKEQLIISDQVDVQSEYFRKDDLAPVSSVSFNFEEVRRAPGSAGDVSRVLMALPSVGQFNHNANDLVVRGGSPFENGFYVDGIQIPNINHFPVQGASGGPIGLINVDFLDDVTFHTGGFPATFGNRLSSIVDMKFRDGNRDAIDTQLDFSMQGIGGIIEGPLPAKRGSWFLSGRRSYLDLILKIMGEGAVPLYGDVHAKVTLDIDSRNTLTLLDIFGSGSSEISRQSAIDNGEETYGRTGYNENTAGATWRSFWSDHAYTVTSLSYTFITEKDDWNNPVDESNIVTRNDYEGFIHLRSVGYFQIDKSKKIEAGFDGEYNPTRFENFFNSTTGRLGTTLPPVSTQKDFSTSRGGVFMNYIWIPADHLTLAIGLRGDYTALNQRFRLSPRFSAGWQITERLALSGSAGIFYQALPSVILSQEESNKNLKDPAAIHYIAGLEYMLTVDTKFSVEVYDKEYRNLPLEPSDPSLSIIDEGRSGGSFKNYTGLTDNGEAYARGVELLLQKKLAKDFYGLISFSLSSTRYRDYSGQWRDRAYDNRYLFCIIGGYKPNNTWEFSVRWNIAGGVPYTPFDIAQSTAARIGIIDQTRINGERYPDYHSLSVRADKRFNFQHSSITLYFMTLNTYDRKNVIRYYWDRVHNQQKADYQWGFIPVIGCEYEL